MSHPVAGLAPLRAPLEIEFDYTRSLGPVLSQFMAALEDQAARRDHGILALAAAQFRALLHPEQGHLAGAAEDGEHRDLLQEIQGIVPPFPGGDHAAIDGKDAAEFAAVEMDFRVLRNVPRAFSGKGAVERYGFFHHSPE